MSRRIAIVGARPPSMPGATHWPLWKGIIADVDTFVASLPKDATVVSGGARGVDSRAERLAKDRGLQVKIYRPNYQRYGQRAPLVRNELIVVNADEIHLFPAPWSRGTYHTLWLAQKARKLFVVHEDWK